MTIGLEGKWGSGKTIVVNLLKEKIEQAQVAKCKAAKSLLQYMEDCCNDYYLKRSGKAGDNKDKKLLKMCMIRMVLKRK